MSKDKKPCSSCPKDLDILPSNTPVEDVIKNFIKNSQTVKPKIEQLFNSENINYKMTTYLKTKQIIIDKKISVEITILYVISKYDSLTKKYNLFSWFISTQILDKNEKDIIQKFFKNPTKYINLKISMIIIGELININNNVKIKPKLQSKTQPKSSNCCQQKRDQCLGTSVATYTYESNGSTNYKCVCENGCWEDGSNTICYSGGNCEQINCSTSTGVTLTGQIY
jgi:hypothetical protein